MPPRAPPLSPLAPPAPPEEFDLFADVSHHGSTLFEFLSLASAPLDPPAFGPRPVSDTTAAPDPAPPPAARASTAVPSYCTLDPSESAPAPPRPTPPRKPRRPAAAAAPLPPSKPISKPAAAAAGARATTPRKTSRAPAPTGPAPANRTASRPGDNPQQESDASEQSDDRRPRSTAKPPSARSADHLQPPARDASSVAEDGQSKDTHNSHTRRCRAKVNSKFQELLSILPEPPANTGIKHKAQILDYTIRVFRDIHARKTLLEAELALSSRSQLQNWIGNVITRSTSLQDALAPYLSLICTKGGWKYSEAWVPMQDPAKPTYTVVKAEGTVSGESRLLTPANITSTAASRLRLGLAVIPSLGNTDDPDLQSKLERFRDRSRSYGCKPRVDLPGRIMCTMRPEWLPSLEDQEAFQRARLARTATLVVCFGVPIFVRGHVAAVALFFDTEQRPYDAKCVDLADNIACLLGNAFGASTFNKKPL